MDSCDRELAKPSHLVHLDRLQSAAELSLRTSSAGLDPYLDLVSIVLERCVSSTAVVHSFVLLLMNLTKSILVLSLSVSSHLFPSTHPNTHSRALSTLSTPIHLHIG